MKYENETVSSVNQMNRYFIKSQCMILLYNNVYVQRTKIEVKRKDT